MWEGGRERGRRVRSKGVASSSGRMQMDPYCNGAAYQGVIAMSFFECLQRVWRRWREGGCEWRMWF